MSSTSTYRQGLPNRSMQMSRCRKVTPIRNCIKGNVEPTQRNQPYARPLKTSDRGVSVGVLTKNAPLIAIIYMPCPDSTRERGVTIGSRVTPEQARRIDLITHGEEEPSDVERKDALIFGMSRHRDNKGMASRRRRPAGPPPQGPRGPLHAHSCQLCRRRAAARRTRRIVYAQGEETAEVAPYFRT